jgi:hypothetical protein
MGLNWTVLDMKYGISQMHVLDSKEKKKMTMRSLASHSNGGYEHIPKILQFIC